MAQSDSDLKRAMFTVSDAVLGAAVLLAIGVYAGSWLDKQLNCSPFCSVGLALLGGSIGLYRMVVKARGLDTGGSGKLPKAIGYDDKDKGESWSFAKGSSCTGGAESSSSAQLEPDADVAPRAAKEFDTTKQRMPYDDFE